MIESWKQPTFFHCLNLWRKSIYQARKLRNQPSISLLKSFVSSRQFKPNVFIVGSPRSGTTFLGEILGNISQVSYYFEPPLTKYLVKFVYEHPEKKYFLKKIYDTFYYSLVKLAPQRGPLIIDKTPRNIFIVNFLKEIYPDAKFIHLIRDGRDVACSLKTKPWHQKKSLMLKKREPGGYLYGPYPYFFIEKKRRKEYYHTSDLHRCIWIWKHYVNARKKINCRKNENSYLEIKYEMLIKEPTFHIKKILEFINVTDKKSHKQALTITKKSFSSSIERWKKELNSSELDIINQEAGILLKELNY